MTLQKHYVKWMKEAGRGHISAFLTWSVFIVWMAATMLGLSEDASVNFFGIGNMDLLLLTAGLGMLLAGVEFAYLFQTKKLDFYYSLPVKKSTIFWTRYVHGLLQFFAPFFLSQLVCALYEVQCDRSFLPVAGGYTGVSILVYGLIFLLFYHLTILGIVAVGKVLTAILTIGLILGYTSIFVQFVLNGFVNTVFENFYRILILEEIEKYFSPIVLARELAGRELYSRMQVWNYRPSYFMILTIFIWIIVCSIFIMFIWKRRKTETTGNAFACAGVERVIEFLASVLAGAVVSTVILKMLKNVQVSDGICVFLVCLSGVTVATLIHLLLETVILGGKRELFRRKVQFLAEGVAVIFLTAGFFTVKNSFDHYQPKLEKIEALAICVNGLDVPQEKYEVMKEGKQNYETDDRLQEYILKADAGKAGFHWLDSLEKSRDEDVVTTATVCYHLKDGNKKYRSYPVSATELDTFSRVYETKEYKEKAYPLLTSVSFDKERISWSDGVLSEPLKVSKEEKAALWTAYQKDVLQMKMQELKKGFPIGKLTINPEISGMHIDAVVYPFFENTKKVLETCGVDVGKTLKDYPLVSAKIETVDSTEKGISGSVTQRFYDEEEDLREWSVKLVPDVLAVQPLLYSADLFTEAEVRVEDIQADAVEDVRCYGVE